MILGIGADLCSIERIARALERHGARFEHKLFTADELAHADLRPHTRAATLAKRFAAKEACAKALGSGFAGGVWFTQMSVTRSPAGAPIMALEGGAAARLAAITPPGHVAHIHLTLTDDHPWAQAFVVIEGRPAP